MPFNDNYGLNFGKIDLMTFNPGYSNEMGCIDSNCFGYTLGQTMSFPNILQLQQTKPKPHIFAFEVT